CSHRAIRRTGLPTARVPCKPTVPTPNFCCCENVVRRWKLSIAGEGTPLIIAPSAVFKTASSPNAARLFQSFLLSIEAQQSLVDASGMCSFHRLVKEKAGRRPLSTIKLIKSDPEAMEAQREDIKVRYRSIFGA